MKKVTTLILTILLYSFSYGQTDLSNNFKELYKQKKYDEIIKYKPQKGEELTAKAHYYVAMSYYMKQQDDNALEHFDLAINKGPVDHDMFFYKGMTLYYKGKYLESLPYFDKAIEMLPNEPDFYGGKGEVFYALNQKDSALHYFAKAIQLPKCKTRIYLLAGELYQDKNDIPNAVKTYESALNKLDKTDKDYQTTLFNVGLMNQLSGNIEKAKDIFEQVLSIYPDDFHCMAKLIQTYYSLDQIDKAKPYREKLYEAHKKKKLPDAMKDMFCFDQFIWNGKRVMAFETFDEPDEFMFTKHHFYIMGDNGEIAYKIDSESSVAIRMNGSKNKYVLCLVKDGSHFTYWQYVFNDDYKYSELKTAVLDILNDKVKPNASYIPGKTNH